MSPRRPTSDRGARDGATGAMTGAVVPALIRVLLAMVSVMVPQAALSDPPSAPPASALQQFAGPIDHIPSGAIGSHSLGCINGTQALPLDGPGYAVLRPQRQRYFGHPVLIAYIESLAQAVQAAGEPGLLVGDLSERHGGPMAYGHASHQSGLDVDIWFRPLPATALPASERAQPTAVSMVAGDGESLDRTTWSAGQALRLRLAAERPQVERIFVHPAIKRELCRTVGGDRRWLARIRPWWGHDAHFHVRLRCPATETACRDGEPLPPGEGCDEGLAWWFSEEARAERRRRANTVPQPQAVSLARHPAACQRLLNARD